MKIFVKARPNSKKAFVKTISPLELCTKHLNTAFQAREIMDSDKAEDKRNLLLDVGQNLKFKDGKLEFRFKKPYDILLLPKFRHAGTN